MYQPVISTVLKSNSVTELSLGLKRLCSSNYMLKNNKYLCSRHTKPNRPIKQACNFLKVIIQRNMPPWSSHWPDIKLVLWKSSGNLSNFILLSHKHFWASLSKCRSSRASLKCLEGLTHVEFTGDRNNLCDMGTLCDCFWRAQSIHMFCCAIKKKTYSTRRSRKLFYLFLFHIMTVYLLFTMQICVQ